jgi:hypothetical protein
MKATRLAEVLPDSGVSRVSAAVSRTAPTSQPSVSARSWQRIVEEPWPMSAAEV